MPTEKKRDSSEELTLCERRSFYKLLLTPYGFLVLLITPLSLGGMLLFLYMQYRLTPKRLWIVQGRLFGTRAVPKEGLWLNRIEIHFTQFKLLFFDISLNAAIRSEGTLLVVSEVFYGRSQVERLGMIRMLRTEAERIQGLERETLRNNRLAAGASECRHCRELFMPASVQPWTAQGFCSVVCATRGGMEFDEQSLPALDSKIRNEDVVRAACSCGHSFSVSRMYRGARRKCPSCSRAVEII